MAVLDNSEWLDFLFAASEVDVRSATNARELNHGLPMDGMLLEELALINRWAHLNSRLVYWDEKCTAASNRGFIGLNKEELLTSFSQLSHETFRTAMFIVLAHETGHMCQYGQYSLATIKHRPRINIEAHADILAGVWIGVRLYGGDLHLSDDVRATAYALSANGHSSDYPTAEERAAIMFQGESLAVMLADIQDRGGLDYHHLVTRALQVRDVDDLYDIAVRTLQQEMAITELRRRTAERKGRK